MQYWLTEQEVEALTGRKQPAAQARVLAKDRIPFRMVNNRPVVVRSDLHPDESRSSVRLNFA
jgi:hypothetical protein